MAKLFHDDSASAETRLLSTVTLERQSLGFVLDEVGGDWGVVGDLFNDEVGLAARIFVGPVAVKELAEDGV